ncbi:phosphoribosyl-amp cyclohydrolase [Liquorilactobacillus sucicola DSM 21376 = JCM 15457]|uniref:Phosphoribosyl-AMP cyclohydrolase n=1 Tax=Liquorilactobacillus sucicola DSM 21376 = JCM 15457 TaxID=1423806 RepID=A0A0R2DSB3_9LACO|nr:phosphoribosyl-AMP cyclohydrolase [Liquorilactobacillus sucicola]KRN06422.1 phosphoribosyl-amp cyclohydrolase [Liquorilactobacillus sucicola DSM 21376 = JCM 15457]
MSYPNFEKGLLTTVVIDSTTREVLMVAWMNEESYHRTLSTKQTWFWSRSRQKLWHKGEESGHTQKVNKMTLDCDEDTLLIEVTPNGPACHTGHNSCFFNEVELKNRRN